MPEPAKEALEEDEGPESDEPLLSRAEAESRGDAEALREIAKSHRSGTRGVAKDMKACFDCYEAAAKLGDPESHYALALFLFTGGVVPADNKAAATHLRAAADGGLVDARVYLANLYELGIHYRADQDKADVWVRSAARAAGLDDAAVDFEKRMAALGVVRFAKPLIDDDATSPRRAAAQDEGARILAQAARGAGVCGPFAHTASRRSQRRRLASVDLRRPSEGRYNVAKGFTGAREKACAAQDD